MTGLPPCPAGAHALAHLGDYRAGNRTGPSGAGGKDLLQAGLVGPEGLIALAHRRQIGGDRLGHGELEFAVAGIRELGLDNTGLDTPHGRQDFDQVADTGLLDAAADLAAGVGHGALELLLDRLRLVEHVHGALLGAARRRHLPIGLLEVHDPCAHPGHAQLGYDQHFIARAEAAIEVVGNIAHQLDVLALVLADGHLVGPVGEHVRSHQHGVEQQPGPNHLPLRLGLVAELVHPFESPEFGDAGQQPGQLGVLPHVALAEQDAAGRVKAGGEQDRSRVVEPLAQLGGFVGHGEGVQIDDAEDALAALLARDVLGNRADVVA